MERRPARPERHVGNIDADAVGPHRRRAVLGNLLYNVANLANPGGPASLISPAHAARLRHDQQPGRRHRRPVADRRRRRPRCSRSPSRRSTSTCSAWRSRRDPITVTLSADEGDGQLLGNVLAAVSSLLNFAGRRRGAEQRPGHRRRPPQQPGPAVAGVGAGVFDTAPASVTPVPDVFVAPVHLDLLGLVDTSPIHLTITAHAGDGLVLGNVVTALAHLFDNPPDSSTSTRSTPGWSSCWRR